MKLTLWNQKLPCKTILSMCNLFGFKHFKDASHNDLPINSRKMSSLQKWPQTLGNQAYLITNYLSKVQSWTF